MPTYHEKALKVVKEMQKRLLNYEADEFALLATKWKVVENSLAGLITALANKEFLTEDQLFRSTLYRQFLREAQEQVQKYTLSAANVIFEGELYFSKEGLAATKETISMLAVRFNRLSPDKVNTMIGLTREDSPLYALLNKSYPMTVDRIANTLITSQALGRSPIETARLMTNDLGVPRTRSLLISRTEQMRANRESSVMQMIQSGVVREKERIEQPDCCEVCQPENGKRYPLDAEADFHPRCRGCWLPIV